MATSRTESSGLTRRQFLPVLGGAAVAAAAPRTLAAAPGGQPGKPPTAEARFVYVGTYTAPGVPPGGTHPSTALGIYVFRMDPHEGDLTPIQLVTTDNPSFLALDPTLTHLYSTNENVGGRFSAYAIDHAHGTLSFINTQPSQGDFPAHLGVHPSALRIPRRTGSRAAAIARSRPKQATARRCRRRADSSSSSAWGGLSSSMSLCSCRPRRTGSRSAGSRRPVT